MTTDELHELDEIIAKAIPVIPSDCWRSKQNKERKRKEAKEKLIALYDRIGAIRETA